MAAALTQLTPDQREFIVRKLAAFYPVRDVTSAASARFGIKLNDNDVMALDVSAGAIVAPELFMLFRKEREAILSDPTSDPYTDQKARLITLSRQVTRYENNNQPADARLVLRQIAEELGVVGSGAKAKKDGDPKDVGPMSFTFNLDKANGKSE